MSVQVDLWTLLSFLVGLFITFMGCIFGFAKLIGGQIDKRLDEKFKAQETARQLVDVALQAALAKHLEEERKTSDKLGDLERDFLKWRGELPIHYVRREDYVQGLSTIQARLDALYNKLEVVQLKGAGHG